MSHPDHSSEIKRINRIQGQLDGIKRMIEEHRYCPDILNQTKAISSAMRSLEASILERHLQSCVRDAMNSKSKKDVDAKVAELVRLFKRS